MREPPLSMEVRVHAARARHRRRTSSIALIGAVTLAAAWSIPFADGADARRPTRTQTSEAALESDLKAIALANGWTLAEARANHRSSLVVDDVVARIREVAPGVLVGAALSDDPMGPATVFIKGPSTPDIDAIIASAPVQVLLVADQPYSLEELEERSIRVAQALLAAGIRSQSVGTDIRNGATIPASISQADGITPDERSAILAAIPDDLRASVQLTVVDPPIAADTCAGGSPSPSPAPGIDPLTCLTFPDDWGPLAVVDDAGLGGLDAGLGPGHLAFRRGCVTLQGRRGPGVTLVWRAGQVRWDVEARQIVFAHATDGLIRLSDGDRMILGGFSPDSSRDPGEEGLRLQPWVQAPRPGCPTESWEVHDLTRLPR